MTLLPRIAGATLPGLTVTLTDDTGTVITDGTSYTWQCQASTAITPGTLPTQLWNKTTGITATASGFTVVWAAADVGSLAATNNRKATYTLEFTGTAGSNIMKHHESMTIEPQIP